MYCSNNFKSRPNVRGKCADRSVTVLSFFFFILVHTREELVAVKLAILRGNWVTGSWDHA